MKKVLISVAILLAIVFSLNTFIVAEAEAKTPSYDITMTIERTTDLGGGIGTHFSLLFADGILSGDDSESSGESDKDTMPMSFKTSENVDTELSKFSSNLLKALQSKYGSVVSGTTSKNSLTISLYFDDYTEYYIACGIDGFTYDGDDEDTKTKNGFFTNYYITSTKTLFSESYKESYLVTDFLTPMMEFANSFGKPVGKVYIYGTKYQGAITSDADKVEVKNNIKYHYFYITDDERIITLTQSSPNTLAYYGIAIGLGLIVVGITVVCIIVKRKKENIYG